MDKEEFKEAMRIVIFLATGLIGLIVLGFTLGVAFTGCDHVGNIRDAKEAQLKAEVPCRDVVIDANKGCPHPQHTGELLHDEFLCRCQATETCTECSKPDWSQTFEEPDPEYLRGFPGEDD